MENLKRFLIMSLSIILLFTCFISGCVNECFKTDRLDIMTIGDFIIISYKDKSTPKGYYVFYDFTEEAKKKDTIIIPKNINGGIIGFQGLLPYANGEYPCGKSRPSISFSHENLKILYIQQDETSYIESGAKIYEKDYKLSFDDVAKYVPKLEKIITNYIYNSFYNSINIKTFINMEDYNAYLKKYYKWVEYKDNDNYNEEFNNDVKIYKDYFYNSIFLANVQYMYNFEGAVNGGHYWVDDVEDGEKIQVKPENPFRKGYTFAGWYNEPECVTEFNFNQIITKEEYRPWNFPENYVTFAYAKWVEN